MKPLDRLLQRIRIRKVAPYIKPGARLLDVGCADGALARLVAGLDYVGIDPEAPVEASAPRCRFVRDVFPGVGLPSPERFDVITALAVLEHVPQEAQAAFAQACARHLVSGGRLLLTVPSKWVDPILDVLMKVHVIDGMETEQHYGFDAASTRGVFEPHGFRLEVHQRFELGLNHLFVFRRVEA